MAGEEGGLGYMAGEEEGGEHPLHGWGGVSTGNGNNDLGGGIGKWAGHGSSSCNSGWA